MPSIIEILGKCEEIDITPPGERVLDENLLASLKKFCCEVCGWEKDVTSFPGSQPISMSRNHLPSLESQDYFVAEKSDGIRYLFLIQGHTQYLIDRNYAFFKLNMFFPAARPVELPNFSQIPFEKLPRLDYVLLDGELVKDKLEDGSIRLRYIAFDCISYFKPRGEKPLPDRLHYIHHLVQVRSEYNALRVYDFFKEPFDVHVKKMLHAHRTREVITNIIPLLQHGNDGLIYTPVKDPYVAGTFSKLLKWKKSTECTVDFKIGKIVRSGCTMYELLAMDKGMLRHYDWLALPSEQMEAIGSDPSATGYVYECLYDPGHETYIPPSNEFSFEGGLLKKGGWRLQRVRTDREKPNDVRVVQRIIDACEHAIGLIELLKFCDDLPEDIDRTTEPLDVTPFFTPDNIGDLSCSFMFVPTRYPRKERYQLPFEEWSPGLLPVPPGSTAGQKRRFIDD
ncbi:hypothetical protein RCL1_002317 [Eukaryota sp. TZLM3-RCL]